MANVLFIDDDESKMLSVLKIFELEGFNVSFAKTAKGGLEIASNDKDKLDLIILDSMMPVDSSLLTADEIERSNFGMWTGLILLERLKVINKNFKIIVLSALDDKNLKSAYMDGGVLFYLIKPYDPFMLLSKANQIVVAKK